LSAKIAYGVSSHTHAHE